jgi:energy-coupling factor transport system permease protein
LSSATPATASAQTWVPEVKRLQRQDAFAALHPALNLLFFLAALVWAVLLRHPAYTAVSLLAAGAYYRLLIGRRAWRTFGGLAVLIAAVAGINPLFNPRGAHPLFTLLGRAYTAESLCYGAAAGGMFAAALLWFFCYEQVVTEDKLTAVLGKRLPALSLLLVMVLRLVPSVGRKAGQISAARRCVGLGGGGSRKERIQTGMTTLSALSSAMLEGSVITADSMRARGYGTGATTSYQAKRWGKEDKAVLAAVLLLSALTAAAFGAGAMQAEFLPTLSFAPVAGAGILALSGYALLLLIPTILHLREELKWNSFKLKT